MAAALLSSVAPVITICTTPAARAREMTAARSASKLSCVRLMPMSISAGVGAADDTDAVLWSLIAGAHSTQRGSRAAHISLEPASWGLLAAGARRRAAGPVRLQRRRARRRHSVARHREPHP